MFTAIHPTAYRSGGFLAHGVLNLKSGSDLNIQTVRVQKKIENAHYQYPVLII